MARCHAVLGPCVLFGCVAAERSYIVLGVSGDGGCHIRLRWL